MKGIDGLELSPKKSEYLKYIMEKGDIVHTTDISKHFNLDPSTITKTIQEMSSTDLIEHIPYRGVRLTPRGREFAEFLVRTAQDPGINALALWAYCPGSMRRGFEIRRARVQGCRQ